MPKKLLAREAHKYSLRVLARYYLGSMQAMEIRLKELGLVCNDMRGVIKFLDIIIYAKIASAGGRCFVKCFYKLMLGRVCLLLLLVAVLSASTVFGGASAVSEILENAEKVLVSRVVDSDTIQLDDGDPAELKSPDGGLVAS